MSAPKEALKDWHTVKPSSFAAYCLMCEVKDSRDADVYLDQSKSAEFGIGKSAYYFALIELEKKGWIEFSRIDEKGKKRWKPIKGFEAKAAKKAPENVSANVEKISVNNSANVENLINSESANVEFSANVETEIPQTWKNVSANVENPPAPPIRNINKPKEEINPKGERERPHTRPLSVDEAVGILENEPELPEELSPTRAIEIYREIYPTVFLDGNILDDFAHRLPEVEESVWRQTLLDWRLARYKSTNIPGMISRYKKDLKEAQETINENGGKNAINQNHRQERDRRALTKLESKQQTRDRVEQRRREKLSGSDSVNR